MHEAVFAAKTPVALELQRAIKHAMGAFFIAEDINQNKKPINADMSLIFVEELAAAAKITEKVLFVPFDLVPIMKDLVGSAMNRGVTEDTIIANAMLQMSDPDMYHALIQLMKRATKMYPTSRHIWKVASMVYSHADKRQDALAAINEAVKLSPRDHELLFMQGKCYMNLRQYAQAKKSYLASVECASIYSIELASGKLTQYRDLNIC